MGDVDIGRVQELLRAGQSPGVIAESLGLTLRSLQRAFAAAGLPSPRAWQLKEIGSRAQGGAPTVFFRLPEFAELEAAAAVSGEQPNEYARNVVRQHLRRVKKKK